MDTAQYSVALWKSDMPFPLNFAVHTWFVVANGESIDRVEVFAAIWVTGESTVIFNALEPTEGFRTTFFDSPQNPKRKSNAVEIGRISGGEESVAALMYDFIMRSSETYPARTAYRFVRGPNSNSFVAWILRHFPDSGFALPWNAFGKGFFVK